MGNFQEQFMSLHKVKVEIKFESDVAEYLSSVSADIVAAIIAACPSIKGPPALGFGWSEKGIRLVPESLSTSDTGCVLTLTFTDEEEEET